MFQYFLRGMETYTIEDKPPNHFEFQYFLRGMETRQTPQAFRSLHWFQYFLRGMETAFTFTIPFTPTLGFNTSLEVWKLKTPPHKKPAARKFQYFLRGMETLQRRKNKLQRQHVSILPQRYGNKQTNSVSFLLAKSFNTSLEVWKPFIIAKMSDLANWFQYFLRGMETMALGDVQKGIGSFNTSLEVWKPNHYILIHTMLGVSILPQRYGNRTTSISSSSGLTAFQYFLRGMETKTFFR